MAEASLETKRYLDSIGSRIRSYHNAMTRAKEFVLENFVTDQNKIMNCIIMSLLWVAAVRKEELSEEELFMFLNLETDLAESKTIALAKDMHDWSLDEVLEYVLDVY